MIGIPASSFHQIGKVLFEKANGIQFNEHLYDSAVSFMKPGSDKLNSSFYDYSSSDSSLDLSLSLIEDSSDESESEDDDEWFFTCSESRNE